MHACLCLRLGGRGAGTGRGGGGSAPLHPSRARTEGLGGRGGTGGGQAGGRRPLPDPCGGAPCWRDPPSQHFPARPDSGRGRAASQSDVEATLQRINNYKGVIGCIVVDEEGTAIRTTCQGGITGDYAEIIPQLSAMARSMVRDLEPQNDLEFLRIRSKKHEIMIAPNKEFTLIVIQDPNASGD